MAFSPRIHILVGIDIQNGFMSGGGLAISNGHEVMLFWNEIVVKFPAERVFFSRDSHPEGHLSFASSHGLTFAPPPLPEATWALPDGTVNIQHVWPVHCVIGTRDQMIHESVIVPEGATIIDKGLLKNVDSYSIAGDAHGNKFEKTDYEEKVRAVGATHAIFMGLALGFCVTASAIDTQKMGIQSYVVLDGCRAIDAHQNPETLATQVKELTDAGVIVVQSISDLPAWMFPQVDAEDKSSSAALE
jgi:nicotinamidase/pyrazinamidase